MRMYIGLSYDLVRKVTPERNYYNSLEGLVNETKAVGQQEWEGIGKQKNVAGREACHWRFDLFLCGYQAKRRPS
jgi:hypothetical protein